MPSWRTRRPSSWVSRRASRRTRPRSRRLTVAAVAGTALIATVGTVVGVAVADVSGGPPLTQASQPSGPTTPVGSRTRSHTPTHSHTPTQVASHRLTTSCRSVAHIGDSTSVDLMSPSFLPDRADRLPARYKAVGVRHITIKASGGRSIVEALPGQVNGYDTARAIAQSGFRGCWVLALGTNDAANIAAGSRVSAAARIDRLMSVAHGQPVLWVNTVTQTLTGPWASIHERAWDAALASARHRYPNLRIFDWAAKARPGWFLPDEIHYNSIGCQSRAKAIADALATAFPGTS